MVAHASSSTSQFLLSPEEIKELTDYTRPAEQRRELERMGIAFEPGRTGRPKVLRSAVEDRLGGSRSARRSGSINIGALQEAIRG